MKNDKVHKRVGCPYCLSQGFDCPICEGTNMLAYCRCGAARPMRLFEELRRTPCGEHVYCEVPEAMQAWLQQLG